MLPDFLLAYAIRSSPPSQPALFRRLARLGGRLGAMSAACFLLDRDPGGTDVERFIFHVAPNLLRQMSRTTQTQRVEWHGQTRGRIDWNATYKARLAAENNPAIFVCLQNSRRYDKPENQLFKFLLVQAQTCLKTMPAEMYSWETWGLAIKQPGKAPRPILQPLREYEHRLRNYLGHIYLRDIEIPDSITERHRAAARSSKNELYKSVVDLYNRYQDIVGRPEWKPWATALNRTLPLPPGASDLGRLLSG